MSVKRITINGTQKVWQARSCLCHVATFASCTTTDISSDAEDGFRAGVRG